MCFNHILLQQNVRGKLRISLSASTVPPSEKYETNKVAKSISAIHDKKPFKNYAANCTVYEDIEDHRKMNFKQCKKAKNTIVSDISELLIDHDYNRDELFTILKHALSLDEVYNNLHHRDMNIIDKNMNRSSIISRSYSFLREKKFSKLQCSQFNHLVNQIFR